MSRGLKTSQSPRKLFTKLIITFVVAVNFKWLELTGQLNTQKQLVPNVTAEHTIATGTECDS